MKLKMDKELRRSLRAIAANIALSLVDGEFPDAFIQSLEQLVEELKRQNP